METAFILIIIGLASTYIVWRFYRSLQNKDAAQCGCGCSSCPSQDNCSDS